MIRSDTIMTIWRYDNMTMTMSWQKRSKILKEQIINQQCTINKQAFLRLCWFRWQSDPIFIVFCPSNRWIIYLTRVSCSISYSYPSYSSIDYYLMKLTYNISYLTISKPQHGRIMKCPRWGFLLHTRYCISPHNPPCFYLVIIT